MQMPNAQFVSGVGQVPSPLETLTKMMMMKQQYEEEEKQRQEQFKAQAERDKLQQEGEMTLAKLKQQMLTDTENAKFQQQLQQAMGAYGNLEGSLNQGSPGYDLLPWAKYYAEQGESMPISPFTASIGAQGRQQIAETQGQTARDVAGIRAGATTQSAATRAGAARDVATIRTEGTREKQQQAARDKELATIQKKAAEIADSETPDEEDIIKAIEYLATTDLMRHKYKKYLDAIEPEVKRFWPDSKKLNPELLQAIVEGREPNQQDDLDQILFK